MEDGEQTAEEAGGAAMVEVALDAGGPLDVGADGGLSHEPGEQAHSVVFERLQPCSSAAAPTVVTE